MDEEKELELQDLEDNFNGIEHADGESGDEEDDLSPDSCVTTSLSEAEVRSRLEEVRSYLYAKGGNGEYSESLFLLSRTVHSFTHETQVKRRAKGRGEVQSTLRDAWKSQFGDAVLWVKVAGAICCFAQLGKTCFMLCVDSVFKIAVE